MMRLTLEQKQERENRKSQLIELRKKGATYRELSELFGISYQRVHQLIGKYDGRYFRTITKDICVYDAIRNWLNENRVSVAEVTRRMYGNTTHCNYERTKGRLNGTIELTKTYIDKILSITNLTYEEAFKRSDDNET